MITACTVAVRYPDCDPMGIVHHAVYPIWYEIARMDYFAKAGFSYTQMQQLGINPPMVNLNLDYFAPVKYPGTVTVRTYCDLCQGKKLRLQYRVFLPGQSTPVAAGASFHVWTGPDLKALDLSGLPEPYENLQRAMLRTGALVLAGGKSTRMGRDKALEPFSGSTLLERAVRFWRAQAVGPVYVASGRESHFATLPEGAEAVADLYPGRGPLAGLQAAFHRTGVDVLWVSAVDMPCLTAEAVAALQRARKGTEDACVFAGPRPEPLLGVYCRSCLPVMDEMLAQGESRMTELLSRIGAVYVPLPEDLAPSLQNVNTPEDLAAAKKEK